MKRRLCAAAVAAALCAPSAAEAQFEQMFGDMLNAIEQQQNQQQNQQQVNPVGDPAANALRLIDLTGELNKKAEELEKSVAKVVYTIKLYQALNGAIWYRLGSELNEIYKLDSGAGAGYVKSFVTQTKDKRKSQQAALRHVEISAVDDIKGENHAIARNNGKVTLLRKSVEAYADALKGSGSFDKMIQRQDVPLDKLMNAYLDRIEMVTATVAASALVFSDMSGAYDRAMKDMNTAIAHFNEQSGILAAEMAKQAAIIALEINNIQETLDNNDDAFGIILAGIQAISVINDLNNALETMNNFNELKDWFDQNSKNILQASRAARKEIRDSVRTIQKLRPALDKSWRSHVAAAKKSASKSRIDMVKFEKKLGKIRSTGAKKGRALRKKDMAMLKTMMKKPRLRGSRS